MTASRRRAGAAVLAVLLVAACRDDGSPEVEAGSSTTATSVTPGDPTIGPGGAPPVATDPVSGQPVDGEALGEGGSADPGATTGGPGPGPGPPALDASGPPGSFAPAVLRPASSSQVVLEIQSAPGAQPSAAVVEHLRATLAGATGKPVAVTSVVAPSGTTWSGGSLRDAADESAATAQGDGNAVLRLLFLHGNFDGDDGVLGVAVRGDVAAIFVDRAAAAAGLLGDPEAIVTSVATHEVGHLLGLVDLVLDTGRADPEHPGHSPNTGSVMYWAVESDLIASLLGSRPPRDFDAADLADLRAIAGG